MPIDDKIKDEKLQYDINKESAKKSVSASDKINNQLVQSPFVTHTKTIEEVHFVDEEFLHKKINKSGV